MAENAVEMRPVPQELKRGKRMKWWKVVEQHYCQSIGNLLLYDDYRLLMVVTFLLMSLLLYITFHICQKMVKQLKWAKLAWACAAYSMPATGPKTCTTRWCPVDVPRNLLAGSCVSLCTDEHHERHFRAGRARVSVCLSLSQSVSVCCWCCWCMPMMLMLDMADWLLIDTDYNDDTLICIYIYTLDLHGAMTQTWTSWTSEESRSIIRQHKHTQQQFMFSVFFGPHETTAEHRKE